MGGVLAAGGGAITVEQAEIYDLFATDEHAVLRRAGDMVIVSADSKGNVSGTASAVLTKYERFPPQSVSPVTAHTSDCQSMNCWLLCMSVIPLVAVCSWRVNELFKQMDATNDGEVTTWTFKSIA